MSHSPESLRPWLREALQERPVLLRLHGDGTPLPRRHLLVRVEGEDGRSAAGAERPAAVLGAERLAGVLDEGEAVPLGDRLELGELGRVAEDVHGEDRLRARRDGRLDRSGVEVQRARVDVREDRRRAFVEDAVGGGDEGERRRHDLVARPQAREPHSEVEPRGAARHRGDVRRPTRSASACSKRSIIGPSESCPERSVSSTSSSSRSSSQGAESADLGGQEPAGALAAYSSQRVQRSSRPRTTSKKVDWIAFVTGPGGPISWSSIERTGVTSAAVPVMKTSSAR